VSRDRRFMRLRVALLGALVFVGAGFVVRRSYELSVERAPALREMAEEQYQRNMRLAPKRGTIRDRNGAPLAVSVDVDSVYANPRRMRREGVDPARATRLLTSVLGGDPERIQHRLESDRLFVWISRRIPPRMAARVHELAIPGVEMVREGRRYYPNRELLSHVLGFADIDGNGIEGLELQYEDELSGSSERVPVIRDRAGHVIFSEQALDGRSTRGADIELTIDRTVQRIAERELSLGARTFEARAGSVIVMDPRTGEILAMANFPSFNANEPGEVSAGVRRDRAITDRFEPGSTIKPFTVASALAAGSIRPEQSIDCEHGALAVAEYTIHDDKPFDILTPAQILAFSSNIGAAKIGGSLGREGLYRGLRRFGFGSRTDIGLPGESAGILRDYRHWYEMDAATIAFGQGMSVNALQLCTAMGALANDGQLMQPTLVRRLVDGNGETLREFRPRVERQVVPRATARLVADMLTGVTGPGGTAEDAALEGYLVAGKTGTAQKADYAHGGYDGDAWVASFVGFVPAEDPRLVISVIIDEPAIAHYGGRVAGPIFRRIAEATLRHLGVPPQGVAVTERPRRAAPAAAVVAPPAPEQVAATDLSPAPGAGETRVPDLLSLAARAALVQLRTARLTGRLEGSGRVVHQDPAPGDVVPEGTRVDLSLAMPRADVLTTDDATRLASVQVTP